MAYETQVQCPACGTTVPVGARFCPACGAAFKTVATYDAPVTTVTPVSPAAPVVVQSAPESNWGAWAAVALIGLLVLGAVGLMLWSYGYARPDNDDTHVVTPPANITVESSPRSESTSEPRQTPPANPDNRPNFPLVPDDKPIAKPDPPKAEIISVSAKATDTNSVEWTYGYTLRLRNDGASAIRTDVQVKFLDAQGYVLDDDMLENLYIPANSEATFEDYDMIKSDIAMRVSTVKAILR